MINTTILLFVLGIRCITIIGLYCYTSQYYSVFDKNIWTCVTWTCVFYNISIDCCNNWKIKYPNEILMNVNKILSIHTTPKVIICIIFSQLFTSIIYFI